MDTGQIIFVYSRLILGAVAAFLAIILWSRTRDIAWMLMVIGTIIVYIDIVCSMLELTGIITGPVVGSVSLAAIVLPALSSVFIISAFAIMVTRRKI